jgi:hypothetical protein
LFDAAVLGRVGVRGARGRSFVVNNLRNCRLANAVVAEGDVTKKTAKHEYKPAHHVREIRKQEESTTPGNFESRGVDRRRGRGGLRQRSRLRIHPDGF